MTIQIHHKIIFVPENSGTAGTILGAIFGIAMIGCGLAFFVFGSSEIFADFPDWVRHLSGAAFVLLGGFVLYCVINGEDTELEISSKQRKLILRKTARLTGPSEKDIHFVDILDVELSKKAVSHESHTHNMSKYILNVSVLYKDPNSGKQKREYVYVGPAKKAEACCDAIDQALRFGSMTQANFSSSK